MRDVANLGMTRWHWLVVAAGLAILVWMLAEGAIIAWVAGLVVMFGGLLGPVAKVALGWDADGGGHFTGEGRQH